MYIAGRASQIVYSSSGAPSGMPASASAGLVLWPASSLVIEFDGDSITNPSFITPASAGYYNVIINSMLPPSFGGAQGNISVASEKVATMASNLPGSISSAVSAAHAAGKKLIYMVFGGTNDFSNPTYPSATVAAVEASWQSCAAGARAAGADYVLLGGMMPRGLDGSSNAMPAGFETNRQALLADADTNYLAWGFDGNTFFRRDPGFNNLANLSNNQLFGGDQTHPLPAGHLIFASYVAAMIMRIGSTASIVSMGVNTGSAAGGTSVPIVGNGGYSGSYTPRVFFGGNQAASVTVVDDTHLTAVTGPSFGTGTAHTMILTKYGSATAFNSWTYA